MEKARYYQHYLQGELAERLQKNPRYSLRSFARALGLSPSTVSRILSGQKIPTPDISQKILSQLSLSPAEEKQFLQSMAKAYEDTGVKRKKPAIKALLAEKKSAYVTRDLNPDLYRIISDWHHYAILQLVHTEGFKPDVKWIAKQLGIQEIEAKLATERLFELELITESKGKWIRTQDRLMSGNLSSTSSAHRKRMKQISEKSVFSLENDPIEIRNHTARTVSIDPENLPLAKELIQEFMDELCKKLQTKKKKVYELQVNLFPLQRSEK